MNVIYQKRMSSAGGILMDKQIVLHIESGDLKIVFESPNSLATLKLVGGQGSAIYLNGSDESVCIEELDAAAAHKLPFTIVPSHSMGDSVITDIRSVKGIGYPLAHSSPDLKLAETSLLEKQVTSIIYELGIPLNIKGCSYLREAIIMTVNNPDIIYALTKELYPAVADIFDTTASRVDRGIRYAITVAWQRMDTDVMKEYFSQRLSFSMTKPTNSEFIATISDRLLQRMKEVGIAN
jgi:hypothetical protein